MDDSFPGEELNPAHGASVTHLSVESLCFSPEAFGKLRHTEETDGFPVSAKHPDTPVLGKVFPEVAQGVGQVGGLALCAEGLLLRALIRHHCA